MYYLIKSHIVINNTILLYFNTPISALSLATTSSRKRNIEELNIESYGNNGINVGDVKQFKFATGKQ